MFKAEQFPASIADLDTCLAKVKAKGLTHLCFPREKIEGSHEGWQSKRFDAITTKSTV
jgi:hypothetical protein